MLPRYLQVPTFGPTDDAAAAANVDGGIVNWISQGYQQVRNIARGQR